MHAPTQKAIEELLHRHEHGDGATDTEERRARASARHTVEPKEDDLVALLVSGDVGARTRLLDFVRTVTAATTDRHLPHFPRLLEAAAEGRSISQAAFIVLSVMAYPTVESECRTLMRCIPETKREAFLAHVREVVRDTHRGTMHPLDHDADGEIQRVRSDNHNTATKRRRASVREHTPAAKRTRADEFTPLSSGDVKYMYPSDTVKAVATWLLVHTPALAKRFLDARPTYHRS